MVKQTTGFARFINRHTYYSSTPMRILLRLYSIYTYIIFVLTFLAFVPTMIVLAQKKRFHKTALQLNTAWSWIYFKAIFIKVKFSFEEKLERGKTYIFCANHFSYLDIPIIAGLHLPFKFIGKSSIAKVPIFGYMFKTLHITVNRSNIMSRARSLKKTQESLKEGFNMMFFPEGGILTKSPPKMVGFKDGAFRLAIEENIPVVPITFPDNYVILPDDDSFMIRPRKCRVIVHKPIYPKDCQNDIVSLKSMTKSTIEKELAKYHTENVGTVG
ncbi:MAG: 1-acyl-sn-glycerol-3-phosphate acyltransferase [Cyclobacteriaceae bacterium]